MITDFTNATSEITKFSLNMLSMQHNYISNNIANANTENYHPSKLDFSSVFQSIETQMNSNEDVLMAISGVKEDLQHGQHLITSNVKGVEIDSELVGLSKNTIMYKALLSALSNRGDFMKIALNSGK